MLSNRNNGTWTMTHYLRMRSPYLLFNKNILKRVLEKDLKKKRKKKRINKNNLKLNFNKLKINYKLRELLIMKK